MPSARQCAENEMCWNLEDYLRRRTNISQWIARGGLGLQNENLPHLKNLAKIFCPNDESKADKTIDAYLQKSNANLTKFWQKPSEHLLKILIGKLKNRSLEIFSPQIFRIMFRRTKQLSAFAPLKI